MALVGEFLVELAGFDRGSQTGEELLEPLGRQMVGCFAIDVEGVADNLDR
ncbi:MULTISPECIES: hypothetical protein [Sphingosinicellaceae]|nr:MULTISPECIES: hypothetical protein [Polymorphobacter]QYE33518.1 hypothetical protein KZX46_01765 [Polymorphobacter sp. PAMC 29334]UAJ12213.1 hypothetical protein KTC28_20435 [Polymorphobacter megasporae]